jgi:predicted permease
MKTTSRLLSLWRNLVHGRRVDRDLDDEMRAMYEQLEHEKRQAGMSADAVRRAAMLELGRIESLKERVHDIKAGAFVAGLVQDVRYAVRLLRRTPVFAVFAVASLALGIGATGAIFSLFDGIVLRKLPVPEPDQLVVASFGSTRFNYSMPYPHYEAIRRHNTTLAGIFALNPFGRVTVGVGGAAQAANGVYVSGDYYSTLRLVPAAGRLLGPNDDRPGQAVAVLNHAYWHRRFGGRVDVLGTAITLNQVPFTIVGVEPAGFSGTEVGRPYEVSIPMRAMEMLSEGKPLWNEAFATWIYMMARMKPGISIAAAEQEMKTIFARVSLDAARTESELRLARENHLRLESGARGNASDLRENYERWLRLLMMLLAAVLLLASLNVATLLLSRSDARQREIATRLAIGAGRARLIRQFLTESLVLAMCAGALGLGLATWGSRVLLQVAAPAAERTPVDLSLDWRLVLFTFAVSCITCVCFGVIPATRATAMQRAIGGRQIGSGRKRRWLDRTLVASQVGLSLVLLVAAGLFLRTLDKLWTQDTGYDRHSVLMFSVDARLAGKKGDAVTQTYRRVLEELRTVAGAQAVTLSAVRPVSDTYYFVTAYSEIGNKVLSREERIRCAYNTVAPGYFSTLGIRLVAGRDFDERDSFGAPRVAIISERLARHFTGNPVGQRLGGSGSGGAEVIGVVRDIRYANVKDLPREVVYFPIFQSQPRDVWYSPTFEIRYAGRPSEVLQSVRDVVGRVDSGLTVFRARTLEEQTEDSFSRERLLAMLASYFGGFAVLLACIGLYGLLSYAVTQRTAEMGLRLALGAPPSSVRWLIVRDSTGTVLAGAAVGLAGAFAAVRLVQTQLFGVGPYDPATITSAVALLLTMAFAAAYLPARRASRIDPLTALRHE